MSERSSESHSLANLLKAIGPGILMAGAAIGGSHIFSSTQAGALFGWQILTILILVNLFKYPFFLYGTRYKAATGESILHGYQRMGKGYLGSFFVLNLANAILNCAGVAFLAAALALNFGLEGKIDVKVMSVIISVVSAAIIIFGRYRVLDKTAKIVILLLAVSTASAVLAAFLQGNPADPDFVSPSPYEVAYFGIIIMFMGWMPAPIDVGAWPSLWMKSREEQTNHRATMREAMIDFHIGYLGTVVLAVFFVALGALVVHGSGSTIESSGLSFGQAFIRLYADSIGAWSGPIIMVAAFTTMFSTTLTCIDAWPRSLATCTFLFLKKPENFRAYHIFWIVFTILSGVIIIFAFFSNLRDFLWLAMVVSFVTSPIFAWINFKVISSPWVPEEFRPRLPLQILSWLGLIFLTVMTVAFMLWIAGVIRA
jgi:Mn2+/Fe2+ NRAMP family transporter